MSDAFGSQISIAAIVPCHNEEVAVGKVIRDLKSAVDGIDVYVYDNNSSDRTVLEAQAAGAIVRKEHRPGKGNVIRRAFADIDADVFVTIDGDDTYEAGDLPEMIRLLVEGPYDHVLGAREDSGHSDSYRRGHQAGNRAFNRLVSLLMRHRVVDMLSGYRVMSRRFVKSFPALSRQFEIETELTVHVIALQVPETTVPIGFRGRPAGSESKLNTYRDGLRILKTIGQLVRYERPSLVYGSLALALGLISLLLGVPVVLEYFATGLVPRIPTALLAASLASIAVLVGCIAVVLDNIRLQRREAARYAYLRWSAVGDPEGMSVPEAARQDRDAPRFQQRGSTQGV